MNAPTDWTSPIAILAAGLVLGALVMMFFGRRRKQPIADDVALTDLHAKRDVLLEQLRDPATTADERTRLELETAEVLRQLDARGAATGTSGSAAPVATAMNPAIKGFLWGAGSVAALAALGYFVMQQATPRAEGGSLTGGFESGEPQAQQQAAPGQPDAAMQQLEAAVQKDPNNLALRNDVAQAYLERENLMAVFQHTQFVLEKSPDDSRALTYQSFVRMAMGDSDGATKMLQRATTVNPQNLDGWVALAWIYAQSDRMNDAERMMAEAAKQSPENKGRLEAVFAQMKQHVAEGAKQPQVAQGDPLPQGHPPIDGAPAAPSTSAPAPAASGPSVRVTLNLDAAAKQRTGVLVVIARNPAGGPPAAVKRVAGATFPMTVELSSA
ncbi:MAG TPA: tetratricopeptide repeat protein, partial [Thermoanaerobaculia bacterium]|nr:tetratricopeptide repeat protein [Thermoanaerobaculia bacterium]